MNSSFPFVLPLFSLFAYGLSPGTFAGETWDNTNGKAATSVLGQANFSNGAPNRDRSSVARANSMAQPNDIAIDPVTGKVFVSDGTNNRVLRFTSADALLNGSAAEAVLGQPDLTTNTSAVAQSRMSTPSGLAFDSSGRLWVADTVNNRVLRFDAASSKGNGANADGVLGQPDFDSDSSATSASGMSRPGGVAVDDSGNLFVSDQSNHRVLKFWNAASKANGANANGYFGQRLLTRNSSGSGPNSFNTPVFIAVDAAGTLWVADFMNNRVLRFDNASNINIDPDANGVLGQINFTANSPGTTGSTLNSPVGLEIGNDGTLWVSEFANHRVLRFENAGSKGNGAGADGVLGQPDLTSNGATTSQSGLFSPIGLALDGNHRLWVCGQGNSRVLRFQADRFQPDGWIGTKAASQRGKDVYSAAATGQSVIVKMKGNRAGKAFFTAENDGEDDTFMIRGNGGNRKLKVKYLGPGGNVTAAITRGTGLEQTLAIGDKAAITAVIKGTRSSRGKRAGLSLFLRIISQTDGETDALRAKVKKKP